MKVDQVESGYEVLYDREAPFELRIHDPSRKQQIEVGTLEAIRVKVLIMVSVFFSSLRVDMVQTRLKTSKSS